MLKLSSLVFLISSGKRMNLAHFYFVLKRHKTKLWAPPDYILTFILCAHARIRSYKIWSLKGFFFRNISVDIKQKQKKRDHLRDSRDGQSGCDAVCRLSTGLSGVYVHVISTRKLHIPAPLPSIIMPCWADTDRTTMKKTLQCKSSIKSDCHTESPQQAPLH